MYMNIVTTFRLWCAAVCLICICTHANSQVTVDAKIDSTHIFIGQNVGITLEVSAAKGMKVELPGYDSLQQIIPGIEYVGATNADTNYINDGKRMVLKKKYFITSFDTALYYIPPMVVKVGEDEFKSKNLALKVYTFDIDTLHVDSIFGMKAEMTPPFVWEDWTLMLWLSAIVLVLTVLLVYVVIRLKDNKPIIRHIRLKPHVAPHKVAMQKIERIREEKIWQKEDSKEYYTQLTDTLRQYINERYGFNAMEMTSYEIIQRLGEVNDEQAISELRDLFQTADLVKFAKYTALMNENDRSLVSAIEYINQTKIEEEVKPQPTEIVVVEKRSKKTKNILVFCVGLAAVVLISVVAYMIYRIIYLYI